MKKILSLMICAALLVAAACLVSCDLPWAGGDNTDMLDDPPLRDTQTGGDADNGVTSDQPAEVVRTFAAIYDQTVILGETPIYMNGRALLYMYGDGTLKIYVCFMSGEQRTTAVYNGRYGENGDKLSLEYTVAEGRVERIENAPVKDGIFEGRFYMINSMTANPIRFYELSPVSDAGDIYIGYFSKTVGANSTTYVYSLNVSDNSELEGGAVSIENTSRVSVGLKGHLGETMTYSIVNDAGETVVQSVVTDIENTRTDTFSAAVPIDAQGTYVPDVTFIKIN